MRHETYTGPIKHLRGKTALIREGQDGQLLAQFDDRHLTLSGHKPLQVLEYEPHARFPTWQDPDHPTADHLGFGWHAFDAGHFTAEVQS